MKKIDAMIRPVFQRTRTTNLPVITGTVQSTNNSTVDTNIRPPVGTLWSMNYLFMKVTATTGTVTESIILYDGTTELLLAYKIGATVADGEIKFGAFGNGPLVITHDRYVILRSTSGGGVASNTQAIAAYEVIS